MGYPTPIEWTDATWNPIGGCSIKSPGCGPCYAQKLAGTRLKNHLLYAGTTTMVKGKPVFNGKMTAAPDNADLVWTWPLRWGGSENPNLGPGMPSMMFVGDMSDLFHEDRPLWAIHRVLAIALLSPHIMQILTKRPDRMAMEIAAIFRETSAPRGIRCPPWPGLLNQVENVWHRSFPGYMQKIRPILLKAIERKSPLPDGPPDNIWLGFPAERQKEFDERWPHMRKLAAQGWTIFLSYEPVIGPLNLPADFLELGPRAQVIAGGMSGKEAVPAHPSWFRAVRDQCAGAGVPFFFKQWGEWHADALLTTEARPGGACPPPKMRIGRKAAGRLLDGVEHNGFPAIASRPPGAVAA